MKYLHSYIDYNNIQESKSPMHVNNKTVVSTIEKNLLHKINLNGFGKDAIILDSDSHDVVKNGLRIGIIPPAIQPGKTTDNKSTFNFIQNVIEPEGHEVVSVNADSGEMVIDFIVKLNVRNRKIRITIQLTESLDWVKFVFPERVSEKNQMLRITFFQAITDVLKNETRYFRKSWKNADPGDLQAYTRYIIHQQRGLFQRRESYKGSTGLLKDPVIKSDDMFISNKPSAVVKILFGDGYSVKGLLDFDVVWKAFKSKKFKHKNIRKSIISRFINLLKEKHISIPTVVSDYRQ